MRSAVGIFKIGTFRKEMESAFLRSGPHLTDDAGLGDGQGLLLHDLVQHRPGGVVHLVELVNAADSLGGNDVKQ